jgi:deoxyribodipyrimidine photo-lyase
VPDHHSTSSGPLPVVVLFREDLRLSDNGALHAAVETGRPVIAILVLDDGSESRQAQGGARRWWLHHSLTSLNLDLEKSGGSLVLRRGRHADIVRDVAQKTGADTVFWNRRYHHDAMAVDAALKTKLAGDGFTVKSFAGHLMHEPTRITTKEGSPFKVYSPFWRAFSAQYHPGSAWPAPRHVNWFAGALESETLDNWGLLPTTPDWADGLRQTWTPGEAGARAALADFVAGPLRGYAKNRDLPAGQTTSRLSPYLAHGEITARQAWIAATAANVPDSDIEKFIKELAWREFSYHLLFHFPDIGWENFNDRFNNFPWRTDDDLLRAWQQGQTGYPLVDAGMRELWQTGWVHNRVRMVVASFLVKHLLIDWREGEAWFADTLVDADPASNTASWQWVAGSGADAAPYFRVFNPITQSRKFDAEAAYVRRYVPELARLDDTNIHAPWEAPSDALRRAGVTLGKTYPKPVVDHAAARERALAAYNEIKGNQQ